MSAPLLIFWLSLSILFFSYAGYGVLVFLWNRLSPGFNRASTGSDYPSVTIIIAAYNEGRVLGEKLANTLAIQYPASLQIIVVSDGSNDGSINRNARASLPLAGEKRIMNIDGAYRHSIRIM